MVVNKLEYNLKDLNKSQLHAVKNVLEENKLNDRDVTLDILGKAGDNFSADVRVVTVKTEDEKDFKIIVKLSPRSEQNAMSDYTNVIFNNEITMYTEVLPAMTQLQENAGLDASDTFKFAKCYGFGREKLQEIILLEDLTKHKYTMLNKLKPLSDGTVKVVLSNLAQYHSLSYAMKSTSPGLYAEFSKKLIDINSLMENEQIQIYQGMGKNIRALFEDVKYKNIITNLFSKESVLEGKKLREIETGSKYSVIVHGDSWTNNILFQSQEDETRSCILIDYQLSKVSSPVTDILYFIFNCTDYETRSTHFNDWLDHYHMQLERCLFVFDLRINDVYPRGRFDLDLMRYAKVSVGLVMLTLSVLMRKSEDSTAMKVAMATAKEMNDVASHFQLEDLHQDSLDKIRDRIAGVIETCFDVGYLTQL